MKHHLARWMRRVAHLAGHPSFRLYCLADRLDPPQKAYVDYDPTRWTTTTSNASITWTPGAR